MKRIRTWLTLLAELARLTWMVFIRHPEDVLAHGVRAAVAMQLRRDQDAINARAFAADHGAGVPAEPIRPLRERGGPDWERLWPPLPTHPEPGAPRRRLVTTELVRGPRPGDPGMCVYPPRPGRAGRPGRDVR